MEKLRKKTKEKLRKGLSNLFQKLFQKLLKTETITKKQFDYFLLNYLNKKTLAEFKIWLKEQPYSSTKQINDVWEHVSSNWQNVDKDSNLSPKLHVEKIKYFKYVLRLLTIEFLESGGLERLKNFKSDYHMYNGYYKEYLLKVLENKEELICIDFARKYLEKAIIGLELRI